MRGACQSSDVFVVRNSGRTQSGTAGVYLLEESAELEADARFVAELVRRVSAPVAAMRGARGMAYDRDAIASAVLVFMKP